jgi:hypothetical protein
VNVLADPNTAFIAATFEILLSLDSTWLNHNQIIDWSSSNFKEIFKSWTHKHSFNMPVNISMKFLVRSATEDDVPCAREVVRSSIIERCDEDHHGDLQVLEQWLRNKTHEFVRGVIAAPNAFSIEACLEAKIVGFALALETVEMTLCYVAPYPSALKLEAMHWS